MPEKSQPARLYFDESGDHTTCDPVTIGKRYLGLVGVVQRPGSHAALTTSFTELKLKHFPDRNPRAVVLHREDILNARGAFVPLGDRNKRAAFDEDLLAAISGAKFTVLAVVIDKLTHWQKSYRKVQHPYHYAATALFERYCLLLQQYRIRGDAMAESRGRQEDKALKETYRLFCNCGSRFIAAQTPERVLTTKDLNIQKKAACIAGLELADLLAHPVTRDVLLHRGRLTKDLSGLPARLRDIAATRYHRRRNRIYGRAFLI